MPTDRCRNTVAGTSRAAAASAPRTGANNGAESRFCAPAGTATETRAKTIAARTDTLYRRTVTDRLPEQLSSLRSPVTEATHALK